MLSSDTGSVCSGRPEVPTFDIETGFTVWASNSRFGRDIKFLNLCSESTEHLGSRERLTYLREFCVSSYGSVSGFRGESLA